MKVVHMERLIDAGTFSKSGDWRTIDANICEAIHAIEWPPGSGSFTLYDQSGKARGQGSGVKPIKQACMLRLESLGWRREVRLKITAKKNPGALDAVYQLGERYFCVEWETGNISSSHRALNKMALGMRQGVLLGGALILPTRAMYYYLTDRIGNYSEIEPYFPLWQSLRVRDGLLVVFAVEHDAVSKRVPRIPKGTDGRSLL